MTVEMQSFGGSTLGAFIQSTLEARGDDSAVQRIWMTTRGETVDSVAYKISDVLTVLTSASLPSGYMSEGCGGSRDAFYIGTWDDTGGGTDSGHLREMTRTWGGSQSPTLVRQASVGGIDGAGGDTNYAYTGRILSTPLFHRRTVGSTNFGVPINSGLPLAGYRADAIGGDSTVVFAGQAIAGAPFDDRWLRCFPSALDGFIQNISSPFAGGTKYTEGAGGSSSRAYFSSVDTITYAASLYTVNSGNLNTILRGPVAVTSGEKGVRGIGGD